MSEKSSEIPAQKFIITLELLPFLKRQLHASPPFIPLLSLLP